MIPLKLLCKAKTFTFVKFYRNRDPVAFHGSSALLGYAVHGKKTTLRFLPDAKKVQLRRVTLARHCHHSPSSWASDPPRRLGPGSGASHQRARPSSYLAEASSQRTCQSPQQHAMDHQLQPHEFDLRRTIKTQSDRTRKTQALTP
eukprot:765521-Hanusia_phi.AAC.2